MRYYQYVDSRLPKRAWRRALDLIMDYDRIKKEADDLITRGHEHDGQPRGSDLSDPTFSAVMARERYLRDIEAVDQALARLPSDVRNIVFLSYKDGRRLDSFPEFAWIDAKRVTKYRKQFVEDVAVFARIWFDDEDGVSGKE